MQGNEGKEERCTFPIIFDRNAPRNSVSMTSRYHSMTMMSFHDKEIECLLVVKR